MSDETYEGGYENYKNFRGVFRNYWSGIFNPRRVFHVPLGYTANLPRNPEMVRADQRPYLWSFMGAAQAGSRPEMLRALLPVEPNFTHITDGNNAARPLSREEYSRVVGNSAFVPCPMGNVNLESFRTYESLEYGSIPLLEKRVTLDYFAQLLGEHPIPTFSTWTQAASFVSRFRADIEGLQRLQSACTEWWSLCKTQIQDRIREFISATRGSTDEPFVSGRYSIPGWQPIELLRHHSVAAAQRRFSRQVRRFTSGQKLRKTEGR